MIVKWSEIGPGSKYQTPLRDSNRKDWRDTIMTHDRQGVLDRMCWLWYCIRMFVLFDCMLIEARVLVCHSSLCSIVLVWPLVHEVTSQLLVDFWSDISYSTNKEIIGYDTVWVSVCMCVCVVRPLNSSLSQCWCNEILSPISINLDSPSRHWRWLDQRYRVALRTWRLGWWICLRKYSIEYSICDSVSWRKSNRISWVELSRWVELIQFEKISDPERSTRMSKTGYKPINNKIKSRNEQRSVEDDILIRPLDVKLTMKQRRLENSENKICMTISSSIALVAFYFCACFIFSSE